MFVLLQQSCVNINVMREKDVLEYEYYIICMLDMTNSIEKRI